MKQLVPILILITTVCAACGPGLKSTNETSSPSTSNEKIGPGLTPAITAVHGSSVDAALSVAPSQQSVSGTSVSAKLSFQ